MASRSLSDCSRSTALIQEHCSKKYSALPFVAEWVMAEEETTADQRPSAPRTARDRARVEITAEILAAARRHLASEGAPSLSLRAIARELGMTSSAVYRYVASRDDLLTWLIVEAYNSLGAFGEIAEAGIGRDDLFGRFVSRARRFASGHSPTPTNGRSSTARRCPVTSRPWTPSVPLSGAVVARGDTGRRRARRPSS